MRANILIISLCAVGLLSGCGGSDSGGLLTDKASVRNKIQSYDTDSMPTEAVEAIKAGCDAFLTRDVCGCPACSCPSDVEVFTDGFLGAIGVDDPALASDSDIQEDIDNLEGVDTSDLEGSCE